MEDKIQTIKQWLGTGSVNIFGRPFAGKDTQGEKLAEYFGGKLMAGGEILRGFHDQDTLQKMMSGGDLIPSDFYLEIILPYLSKEEYKNTPLILSSLGRMKGEESTILQATKESGHEMKAVVVLDLTEEEVMNRFEATRNIGDRGTREDDNHDALENRLVKYREQTIPVLDVYRQKGLITEVDGTLPREKVTLEILNKLYEKATA